MSGRLVVIYPLVPSRPVTPGDLKAGVHRLYLGPIDDTGQSHMVDFNTPVSCRTCRYAVSTCDTEVYCEEHNKYFQNDFGCVAYEPFAQHDVTT